jgi:hypothetical protein
MSPQVAEGERLAASDVLELLALIEVIEVKAGYGQHTRWIEDQSAEGRGADEGLDTEETARLRRLVGSPDDA